MIKFVTGDPEVRIEGGRVIVTLPSGDSDHVFTTSPDQAETLRDQLTDGLSKIDKDNVTKL